MSQAELRRFLIAVVTVTIPGAALSFWAGALSGHDPLRRPLELIAVAWFGLGILICVAALVRLTRRWRR